MVDTVYFQIAEVADAAAVADVVPSDTALGSSYYNTTNARSCIIFTANYADNIHWMDSPSGLGMTDFWLHYRIRTNNAAPDGDLRHIKIYGDNAVEVLGLLAATGTPNHPYHIQKNDGGWSTLLTATGGWHTNAVPHSYDLHVVLGNPGTIELYDDGVLIAASASLNLTWAGVTNISKIRFQGHENDSVSFTYYSEIVCANWKTISCRLVTRGPDGAGNYTGFDSGAYTDIDEVVATNDFAYSQTVDQRLSVSLASFPALGTNESVETVQISAWGLQNLSGPQNADLFMRISATDYDGSDQPFNYGLSGIQEAWATNPNTTVAWTVSDLDALEIGIRSRT